ncbi:MAG: PTS sugar transporter subunit IIA [Erysipelotrichaceae bacterium]
MIGILLVSHGKMAEGMKDSIELIMGEVEQLNTVSLVAGEDIEQFKLEVLNKTIELDTGDGVLVYVDLFGASPYNATQYASRELVDKNIEMKVLTGMNLPMLLESLVMREYYDIHSLVKIAKEAGQEGISESVVVEVDEEDSEGDY